MQNIIDFLFQFVDMIFISIFVMADIIRLFMPDIDIVSGIVLFVLSMGMIFLMMKIIEKEMIFKSVFLFVLIFVFFGLIKRVEILNEVTAYSSSLAVGIFLLLGTAAFISLDDESEEYV